MAEEAQRRLEGHRVFRHQREENLVALGVGADALLELVDQAYIAVHAAQVEEDVGVHQGLLFRHRDPAVEIPLPDRQWLAPLRVRCHDIARTVNVAAGIESVVDDFRQCREVVVVTRCRRIVEHERVVLVALGGLLVPPL